MSIQINFPPASVNMPAVAAVQPSTETLAGVTPNAPEIANSSDRLISTKKMRTLSNGAIGTAQELASHEMSHRPGGASGPVPLEVGVNSNNSKAIVTALNPGPPAGVAADVTTLANNTILVAGADGGVGGLRALIAAAIAGDPTFAAMHGALVALNASVVALTTSVVALNANVNAVATRLDELENRKRTQRNGTANRAARSTDVISWLYSTTHEVPAVGLFGAGAIQVTVAPPVTFGNLNNAPVASTTPLCSFYGLPTTGGAVAQRTRLRNFLTNNAR